MPIEPGSVSRLSIPPGQQPVQRWGCSGERSTTWARNKQVFHSIRGKSTQPPSPPGVSERGYG